jgi:hypothetical protein
MRRAAAAARGERRRPDAHSSHARRPGAGRSVWRRRPGIRSTRSSRRPRRLQTYPGTPHVRQCCCECRRIRNHALELPFHRCAVGGRRFPRVRRATAPGPAPPGAPRETRRWCDKAHELSAPLRGPSPSPRGNFRRWQRALHPRPIICSLASCRPSVGSACRPGSRTSRPKRMRLEDASR